MPVTIIHSNKPLHGEDDQEMSAPIILMPKIDKLSVCIPVLKPEHQKGIEDGLITFLKDPKEGIIEVKGSGGYKFVAKVHVPDGLGGWAKEFLLMQVGPYSPKASYVRLEWNPAKMSTEQLFHLKSTLTFLLPWGYEQLLETGKITRLDLAFDLPGTRLDNLILKSQKAQVASHFFGPKGNLETVCLGRSKSNQIVAYDKAKELAKHGAAPIGPITRIEFRLKLQTPFLGLPMIKNPLHRLKVFDLSTYPAGIEMGLWRLFQDSCRIRGIKAALQMAGQNAALLKKALKPTAQTWWDPDKLWGQWPDVVAQSGLLETA